jgi:Tfp pilus assembly protein PilX
MKTRLQATVRTGERGAALFISLIALVFMLLGGLALIRSVDIGNLIAGNLSFKQASLQASDVGSEAAFTLLNGTIIGASEDGAYPAGCTQEAPTSCNYLPLRQAEDSAGVPTAVGDWSAVPSTTMANGYQYQFVIDRLCQGPVPVTDLSGKCIVGAPQAGGTKKAGGVVFTSATEVYYRVTIRATGPRDTRTVTQVLFAR